MIALKIIGAVFAAIIIIIFLLLMANIRVDLAFSTENPPRLKVKLLFFTVYDIQKPKKEKKKKKDKKPSRIAAYFKRLFGLDGITSPDEIKEKADKKGVSDTVNRLVTAFALVAGQAVWLVKRVKLKRFSLTAVCAGDDAADAAMDYGLACSAVYPFVGYLQTSFDLPERATDIRIACDFEGEAQLHTELYAKLRIIHILRAILRNASAMAESELIKEAKQ
jgi:hypothetical protein